ncbi:MAG TPA: hypothetical protein VGE72_31350 [Azospirillum sp.]
MKRALRFAAILAVPLALAACNQTGGGGGLFGGSGGGLFGDSGSTVRGGRSDGRSGPYAFNGRCDDPRYNTSGGGRAEAGTDEFDCSRYGDGLKR